MTMSSNQRLLFVLLQAVVLLLLLGNDVYAFSSLPTSRHYYSIAFLPTRRVQVPTTRPRLAANKKKEEEENDDAGMADAFKELDALGSLNDDNDETVVTEEEEEYKTGNMEKAMERVDLTNAPKVPPEEELKRYTQMYEEADGDDGDELYTNVMMDMGGTPKQRQDAPPQQVDATTSGSGSSSSSSSMDDFMNAALEQALKEAKEKTPKEIRQMSENILDDEEMMDEIRQVFEKGNKELLEGLEDIRKEQSKLAKASAEQNSKERQQLEKENAIRIKKAQESMVTMLEAVNRETQEVEKAVQDLKKAQRAMDDDPMMKLVSGNVAKQAALVGALLFTVRAGAETIAMVGGGGGTGGDHAVAALAQGALAIACAAYFFS